MLFFEKTYGAEFSNDRKYRYSLWRIWNESLPLIMVIGLNPSNANADQNDPTINNLIRMVKRFDYGGFYMMNCFPLVSSIPDLLIPFVKSDDYKNQSFINDCYLHNIFAKCKTIVFAWGNFEIVSEYSIDKKLIEKFPNAYCFGRNKNRTPMHPLSCMYKGIVNTVNLTEFTND